MSPAGAHHCNGLARVHGERSVVSGGRSVVSGGRSFASGRALFCLGWLAGAAPTDRPSRVSILPSAGTPRSPRGRARSGRAALMSARESVRLARVAFRPAREAVRLARVVLSKLGRAFGCLWRPLCWLGRAFGWLRGAFGHLRRPLDESQRVFRGFCRLRARPGRTATAKSERQVRFTPCQFSTLLRRRGRTE
jgi:hypothetical protein